MKREDIIRMAREADREWDCDRDMVEWLEWFAALVAAAAKAEEREALEKIDWTVLLRQGGLVTWGDAETLGDRVIDTIRARGQS